MAKAQANAEVEPKVEAAPEVEAIDINDMLRLVEEAAAQYPLASQIVTHVDSIRSLIRIK
jgi:hypothetical protein